MLIVFLHSVCVTWLVDCCDIQPLIDCYSKLRETGRVVLMSLSETWLRSYQVRQLLCAVDNLTSSSYHPHGCSAECNRHFETFFASCTASIELRQN